MENPLKKILYNSVLDKNDNILLHADFRRIFFNLIKIGYKISPIEILNTILEFLGPSGTLILPTFNYDFTKGTAYNYFNTKSQMGVISETARKHPDIVRTLNPTFSFAAFGKESNRFNKIDNKSFFSKESPFDIIFNLNFKISILDLEDNNSMTFLHYCEEINKVNWRYYKNFTAGYTGPDNIYQTKTYVGYMRKKNIITDCNRASKLL